MSLYVAEYKIYIEIQHVRDARAMREQVESVAARQMAAVMPEGVKSIRTEATVRPAYYHETFAVKRRSNVHMLVEGPYQGRALCNKGAHWWKTTLNPAKVTCKTCLERMKK